ncbi:MAG TPA: hypothetical protein VFY73_27620 [Ideonella sp.]|uniref:hypothetical protein n=1 Tax=Ideonella sp. TaxID=1929293 RepID=UPI002E313B4C|nr:hypothetical protein [Ideonella sp.]HEX5687801.1 hypothetical protein [Ideonella sp.]
MKTRTACLLAAPLLTLAMAAHAADPVYITLDHSTDSVMDKAAAQAIWAESLAGKTLKLNKLYPTKRWGFVSEVEGGFNQAKTCVVTARVMMMPATVAKSLVFKPNKTATAFDAMPNATREQCQDLAKAKLKEAIQGVLSSLSN